MKIKDILSLETDNSCAICRECQKENLTEHHIDGNNNNNDYDNRIIICWNCHQRYNQKKGISVKDIKERKKILIQKTLTQYGINALKIASRRDAGIVALPFLVFHLVDMGYLKKTGEIMYQGDADYLVKYKITFKGKTVYEKWLK